jgi:hypothetical protein
MATLNKGYTFTSGDVVTPTKLNNLVDLATLSPLVNADISATAAIAHTKLASIDSGKVILGNASNVPTATALSGDVSINGSGVVTIANQSVSENKIASGAVTGAAGGGKLSASVITGQTQLTDPLASNDEFLVHDASASALRRAAWSALQPPGSIIQTIALSENLSSTRSSTSISDSGITAVSLTRKLSNSKILLTLNGGRFAISGGNAVSTYFYVSHNGGTYANVTSGRLAFISQGGGSMTGTHSVIFIYTPASNITTIAFKVYYATNSSSVNWHQGNAEPFFVSISEIS